MNIVNLIQKEVNRVVNIKYVKDRCKPIFSVVFVDESHLILTCNHLGSSIGEAICFEEDLEDIIERLYNSTM